MSSQTPFRVVEMALEIQVEKMRVVEATKARDAAVYRLLEAYTSVRRHSEVIEQLQKEREERGLEKLGHSLSPPAEYHDKRIVELEEMIADLRDINLCLKEYGSCERKMLCDPPPHYEGKILRVRSFPFNARRVTDMVSFRCRQESRLNQRYQRSYATLILSCTRFVVPLY
jgi:hypothetical protein